MNNEVQAIIKEKCTAVHQSVEWRFRNAAVDHMERLRQGKPSEMEPIIFKGVIPLFGQSDIRGSSEARVHSIQADLTEQLSLAGTIMRRAVEIKSGIVDTAMVDVGQHPQEGLLHPVQVESLELFGQRRADA